MGAVSYAANAATEIQWWHAMGGVNGERVKKSPMTLTPPSQITMWFLYIKETTLKQ